MKLATRMDDFTAYLGPAMNQKLAVMRSEGRDIINLGLGDPDVTPQPHQLDALKQAVAEPTNHHYPSGYPIAPFYEAVAGYYRRKHGVTDIDPESDIIYALGAAEMLYQIHQVLVDRGDTVLISDPAYPTYEAAARIVGGTVEYYPLLAENDFLPDLDAIPEETAKKAKLIWINLPNNPTAAAPGEDFWPHAIAWAKKHDVWIVSDAPYLDIVFDGYEAPSLLKYPGAKDVGVELNSMSKSFNACGWRVGYAIGNNEIIGGLAKLKSQTDRGLYYPLQVGATAALNGDYGWMDEKNSMFEQRRDVVLSAWKKLGLEMQEPKATFYCWGAIPDGFTSRDFAFKLLEDQDVWMIPGSTYGPSGEGYIRISCARPAERIQEAMDRLEAFLG